MKTSVSAITPEIYGVRTFFCPPFPKTQYAYRLIGITEGRAVFTVAGEETTLGTGAVIFLCPGDMLSIDKPSKAFDAAEVFFDFTPYRVGLTRQADDTVSEEQFNPLLCSPQVVISDTDVFDAARVFHDPEAVALLCAMRRYDIGSTVTPLAFRGLLCAALASLVRGASGCGSGRSRTAADIIAYINAHTDAALSPHSVADAFGYHVNYVNSLIRAQTGMPLGTYIKTAKIRVADRLLAEGTLTLSKIAEALGYFDYSHFYKAYRSVTGTNPARNADAVTDAANTRPMRRAGDDDS